MAEKKKAQKSVRKSLREGYEGAASGFHSPPFFFGVGRTGRLHARPEEASRAPGAPFVLEPCERAEEDPLPGSRPPGSLGGSAPCAELRGPCSPRGAAA